MAQKRKVYAPFSLTSEAGVAQTPVEGYIDVNQVIYPTVNTGTVNENGKWTGVKSDDLEFIGFTKGVQIAAGGTFLVPDSNEFPSIDMTGFRHLQFAIKGDDSFTAQLTAVQGPEAVSTLNLGEAEPAVTSRVLSISRTTDSTFNNVLGDTSEQMYAKWRVFTVLDRFTGLTNVQILITNNSGSAKDIDFAFRRLI